MYEIQEINAIETLAEHRELWQRLLDETADATFFHTLDWLLVYWKHYGAEQRLRTLIVSQDGRPLGILPMVVRHEQRKIGPVAVLTYPLDDWGSFYGPLGPCPAETLEAGLDYFARADRDWDVLDVRWVSDDAQLRRHAEDALAQADLPAEADVRATTALIDLPATWDAYLASLPSKFRNNYKRWLRRVSAQGELKLIRYRPAGSAAGDDDPRWDLYDECEAIARRSWQGSSTTGTTLSSESIRPFLRDVHAAAVKAGCAEINLLMLGDRSIAYAYNYYYQGRVYGLRIGYDAAAAKDGAGNLLYAYCIRDSIERGDVLYDLGPGSLDYKRHWATRFVPIWQYTHCNRRAVKGRLLRAAHKARRWLRERQLATQGEQAA